MPNPAADTLSAREKEQARRLSAAAEGASGDRRFLFVLVVPAGDGLRVECRTRGGGKRDRRGEGEERGTCQDRTERLPSPVLEDSLANWEQGLALRHASLSPASAGFNAARGGRRARIGRRAGSGHGPDHTLAALYGPGCLARYRSDGQPRHTHIREAA